MEWYIPALIFLARVCDVSMGTVRMIFVISGWRITAAGLGFIEVIIWVLAVSRALEYVTEPLALIAYAGGFAAGTMVGVTIEGRLAIGYRLVRIITPGNEFRVCETLRNHGYRATRIEGQGKTGPVEIAFAVIRRKHLDDVLALIDETAPEAFVTVERADHASGGGLTADQQVERRSLRRMSVRK